MSNHTPQEIESQFQKAPELIRERMFSADKLTATRKIGEKYRLHIDRLGELTEEIDCVMLGLEPAARFVKNIEERLKLDQPTAENIALEVNAEIFLKVRESLKQLQERQNTLAPEKILAEIQNPAPAAPTAKIFERKLSAPVSLKPAEAIAPAPMPPPPPIQKIDPYLEPLDQL